MSISYQKKLIFIHIPKTGGQSIHSALNIPNNKQHFFGFHGPYEYSHFTAMELKKHIDVNIFNKFFKFTIIRNPFERLVSEYYFKKKGDNRFINVTNLSFHDFVLDLNKKFHLLETYRQRDICHFVPQFKFIYDNNNNSLLDEIFRFEDFNTKISEFIFKVTNNKIPHKNSTKHNHYKSYYDITTRKIVETIYEKDLEKFNYVF